MGRGRVPVGRRERDKRAKRERIMAAARELFAERGVSGSRHSRRSRPSRRDVREEGGSRSRTAAYACTSSSSATRLSPYRRAGLALAARLEDGIAGLVARDEYIRAADAATLARVITAIIHISTTATVYLHRSDEAVLADIRDQIHNAVAPRGRAE